jgi:hypothetical protein
VIIEMFGAPGAGKTNLAKRIAAGASDSPWEGVEDPDVVCIEDRELWRKVADIGRGAWKRWSAGGDERAAAAWIVRRIGIRGLGVLSWVADQHDRAGDGRAVILDQGVAQLVWSVLYRGGSWAEAGAILRWKRPDAVWYLEASVPEIAERLAGRTGSRAVTQRRGAGALAHARAVEVTEQVSEFLEGQGIAVMRIQG